MTELNKTKCKNHTNEYISNFCAHSNLLTHSGECLIGLCASCISSHTDYHYRCGTSPTYQNIKDSYLITEQKVVCFKERAQEEKERIVHIELCRKNS